MARLMRKPKVRLRWPSYTVLVLLGGITWWTVTAIRLAEVPSRSMEPTLLPGDLLVMRIDAYRGRMPERGDVVIFKDPTEKAGLLVKRVIGVAGDDVHVQGGVVWLNGKLLREPYVGRPYFSAETHQADLEDGQLWVMGDNRLNSEDSRDYGPVATKGLVGRASAIIWPMARRQRLERGTAVEQ